MKLQLKQKHEIKLKRLQLFHKYQTGSIISKWLNLSQTERLKELKRGKLNREL